MPTRHALIVATVSCFFIVAAIGYEYDADDHNELYKLENAQVYKDLPN